MEENTLAGDILRGWIISFPGLGITGLNPPASFTLFGHTFYFYGVLIALGFLAGILFCARNSSRFGIQQDDFFDAVLFLIPAAILSARIYFVLFRLNDYIGQPFIEYLAVWKGGLAIYGGIIGSILTVWLVCRHKKIPCPAMLDLMAFGVLIGQIIGRWGNFMNREAYGSETQIFCRMGLTDPTTGASFCVHPTFLYESLWNLAIFIGLLIWERKGRRKYDGQIILLYLFFYGLGRAWIEGLRQDSLMIGSTGIRVSQALSLVLVLCCGTALFLLGRREHPAEKLYVNRAAGPEEADQAPTENGSAADKGPAEIAAPVQQSEETDAAQAGGPAELSDTGNENAAEGDAPSDGDI